MEQPLVRKGNVWKVRCPCCGNPDEGLQVDRGGHSARATRGPRAMEVVVRLDEAHTALVRPQGCRFHEYRYCVCRNPECGHAWGLNPTGKWFEVDPNKGGMISSRIDHKLKALAQAGGFCEAPPVQGLLDQRVVLFTGAGCSVAVGYPRTSRVLAGLPDGLLDLCHILLRSSPRLKHKAIDSDIEILLDELLKLQVLSFQATTAQGFLELTKSEVMIPSDFIFNEAVVGDPYTFYPPTPPLLIHGIYGARLKSDHVGDVSWMLRSVLEAVLRNYSTPPSSANLAILSQLIEGMRYLNPDRNLAAFTTNYDSSLEEAFGKATQTGMVNGTWNPAEGFGLGQDEMSVFRLHGASRWILRVDIPEGSTSASLNESLSLSECPESWSHAIIDAGPGWIDDRSVLAGDVLPALLLPSTVKMRYTHSPPYNYAYQQLQNALTATKVLACVGYSCRDETMKHVLHRCALENPDLQVVVLDMEQLPLDYLDAIPDDRVHLVRGGLCMESIEIFLGVCKKFAKSV